MVGSCQYDRENSSFHIGYLGMIPGRASWVKHREVLWEPHFCLLQTPLVKKVRLGLRAKLQSFFRPVFAHWTSAVGGFECLPDPVISRFTPPGIPSCCRTELFSECGVRCHRETGSGHWQISLTDFWASVLFFPLFARKGEFRAADPDPDGEMKVKLEEIDGEGGGAMTWGQHGTTEDHQTKGEYIIIHPSGKKDDDVFLRPVPDLHAASVVYVQWPSPLQKDMPKTRKRQRFSKTNFSVGMLFSHSIALANKFPKVEDMIYSWTNWLS